MMAMNKQEFLNELQCGLAGMPQSDIEERLTFYSEMIDDGVEEGLSEETAVANIGDVVGVISQILEESQQSKAPQEEVAPKRKIKAWEIVLLVLGSPIWVSLLAAFLVVVLALYIVLWSVVISVYAVELSIAVSAVACIPGAIVSIFYGNFAAAGFIAGGAFILTGLAVFLFFASIAVTKGIILASKNIFLWIKRIFAGKESAR